VRARLIVIRRIRSKNSPQVRLTKDQQSVQALAAHGADQAFRIAILPGRSRRDRSVTDSLGASVELRLSKIAHLRLIADETEKWAKVVLISRAWDLAHRPIPSREDEDSERHLAGHNVVRQRAESQGSLA
jgi:hypothetical protein